MANSAEARVIYHDKFDASGFTNENTLAKAMLTEPDKINPIVTWLMGKESDRFPLSFLTEGQAGGIKYKELEDIQYEWDVFNRLKKSDAVKATTFSAAVGSTAKPGVNNTPIFVTFETNWLKQQHLIVSPRGYVCRIQGKPINDGTGYLYKLHYVTTNKQAYVDPTEFAVGKRWSMEGGAPVSESYSMGNASNKVTPGKMKNQMSILRKSFEWGGNVARRKVANVQLPTEGGGTTDLWMPFERWQHTMQFKEAREEHMWRSIYNRDEEGVIVTPDEDSDLPVPMGAGLLDQIPNEDTYGILTATKIKNTVGDIFYGMTDSDKMDVVLYTGLGGAEEFDTAMKEESKNFTQITGDKFTRGAGRNLVLGGFYTQYEHIDGHVVTVKLLRMLDHGSRAENGMRHPRTGKPISSYDMYFIDQSSYDGVKNVQMVTQRGRSMITGVLRGMAPGELAPLDWGGNSAEYISTEQDKSSVHFLGVVGCSLNRNTTSFKLRCDLV